MLPCYSNISVQSAFGHYLQVWVLCRQASLGKWVGETERVFAVGSKEPCFLVYSDRSGLLKAYSGIVDRTVPYMMILEPLLWVRPTLENLCGLWVGSQCIFLLTLRTLRCIQQTLPSHSDGEHSYGDQNLANTETSLLGWLGFF